MFAVCNALLESFFAFHYNLCIYIAEKKPSTVRKRFFNPVLLLPYWLQMQMGTMKCARIPEEVSVCYFEAVPVRNDLF